MVKLCDGARNGVLCACCRCFSENQDAFFMSILFRIVFSLNHFQLPLFMLSKENVTFLRWFLGLYSLSKLRVWLNQVAFFMSILFRIFSSLNHFQLPLFMLSKVNDTF